MIPVEIQESSPRFQNFVEEDLNEERRLNLDLKEDPLQLIHGAWRRLGGSP